MLTNCPTDVKNGKLDTERVDKFEATESSYWVVKSILEYNYKHCQWYTTLILVLTEIIYLIKEKSLCLKWIQIKTDEISFGLGTFVRKRQKTILLI